MSNPILESPVTETLGTFIADTRADLVPDGIRIVVARLIAHVLICAATGNVDPTSMAVFESMRALVTEPEATIIGHGGTRAKSAAAAFCNATSAGTLSQDDDDLALATPVVMAALAASELAVAEGGESTAARFLVATATGLEIAYRMRSAVGNGHRARGWFVPGTVGRLGASAAVARALALDSSKVAAALGFAATQAAGLASSASGSLGAVVIGRAAADGVESALLASAGLSGPPRPLEGRRGLFALEAPGGAPAMLLEALGQEWLIGRSSSTPSAPATTPRSHAEHLSNLVALISADATLVAVVNAVEEVPI
jgi:2-methylcitrate dehydratase PrpD